METKLKELYEAPSTMFFEFKQEGVICTSNGDGIGMPGGEPALPF